MARSRRSSRSARRRSFTGMTPDLRAAIQAFEQSDFARALHHCDRCLAANRHDVNALHLKGRCLTSGGLFQDAQKNLDACLKLVPDDPRVLLSKARLFTALGRPNDALAALTSALRSRPGFEDAWLEKAGLLERMGRYEEAEQCLERVADTGPRGVSASYLQCLIHLRARRHETAIEHADRLLTRTAPPDSHYRRAAYIKGKALDALGRPDAAMDAWIQANDVQPTTFDPAAFAQQVDEFISFFTPRQLAALPDSGNQSEAPVFIVGMPRSGTTLVEQIIDAHPQVHGAGELRQIEALAQSLPDRIQGGGVMPSCLAAMTSNLCASIAREYERDLRRLKPTGTSRVVNKSLENYWHVGLLSRMFPRARFIFVRRHPIDTCLSVFMNWFNPLKYPFAGKLEHIGLVYRQVKRLMDHWRSILDEPILEVEYEAILAEPEANARQMIAHLNLEWDERCVRFHESQRLVLTLSYAEVSRPIYTTSRGRWERYQPYLKPLLDALTPPD